MLLAQTVTTAGIADHLDAQLSDQQSPNLVYTTGRTMTALALALALGGDDANDVDIFNPLVATGRVDEPLRLCCRR